MSEGRSLETQVAEWRSFVSQARVFESTNLDELESHLRDRVADLCGVGLREDEAFLIAVKRMGSVDDLTREFALEHSDRLWKQLVLSSSDPSDAPGPGSGFGGMILFAVGAALAVKVPEALGLDLLEDGFSFFARNVSLLVLPLLVGFLAWRRRPTTRVLMVLAGVLAAAAVVVNLYPFVPEGVTEILVGIHLPIALWAVVGVAYMGGEWRSHSKRMDFVRFTGEWFIYFVLIALGGGVLMGLTIGMFDALGLDAAEFVTRWILPTGAAGAVIVAAWLVEAKQGVIENMAPVLTSLFTPLFAVMLTASVAVALFAGGGVEIEREALIVFDALLVVVTGLLLYAISAREPHASSGIRDITQLVLLAVAVALDVVGLSAMVGRISEFGFSPNKTAALGLNLVLLMTLVWSAWKLTAFVTGKGTFHALERWQTASLPTYLAWAAVVVVVFPPVFGFV
jgi:hypothetical protein